MSKVEIIAEVDSKGRVVRFKRRKLEVPGYEYTSLRYDGGA